MRSEEVAPAVRHANPQVKVHELREGQKRRGLQDRDTIPQAEKFIVQEERVFGGEEAQRVCVHRAAVVYNDDVLTRPARRYVAQDGLLQHGSVAGKRNEQRRSRSL